VKRCGGRKKTTTASYRGSRRNLTTKIIEYTININGSSIKLDSIPNSESLHETATLVQVWRFSGGFDFVSLEVFFIIFIPNLTTAKTFTN